ncbi:MAG: hypothetical protein NVSMB14_07040 [Isosphaeraceae bacterium]
MSLTQPISRLKYARKEVVRYREDAREFWKNEHDKPAEDFWPWVDLVAKANVLFGKILELDIGIQELLLVDCIEDDEGLEAGSYELLRDWLEVSLEVSPHVDRLATVYGSVDGALDFRKNVRQAQSILTPDDEYFRNDKLAEPRDKAIDDRQAGRTEPLHGIDEVE